jgi:protein SCO1/2
MGKRNALLNVLLGIGLLLAGCQTVQEPQQTQTSPPESQQPTNDVTSLNWQVPDFQAKNQANENVSLVNLKGKVWLVDFIFTRCPNICPPMTANMVRVQQELVKQHIPVEIISFSVDPQYDQPDVLKAYAEKHRADLSHWSFLTGYDLSTIQQIAKTAFKGSINQQKGPSSEVPILVNHPSQFYLIDQTGKVRKFYNGLSPNPRQIAQDAKTLIAQ